MAEVPNQLVHVEKQDFGRSSEEKSRTGTLAADVVGSVTIVAELAADVAVPAARFHPPAAHLQLHAAQIDFPAWMNAQTVL